MNKTSQNKFLNDLAAGQAGEKLVGKIIQKLDKANEIIYSNSKEYDFELRFKDGKKIFYEVKTDFMSFKTGNIFFEYSCNGLISGLACTSADKYAILLLHLREIFVFEPEIMWNYLRCNNYRRVNGGDNFSVMGYIVPIIIVRELPFVKVIS